jgi:hypothetical protein
VLYPAELRAPRTGEDTGGAGEELARGQRSGLRRFLRASGTWRGSEECPPRSSGGRWPARSPLDSDRPASIQDACSTPPGSRAAPAVPRLPRGGRSARPGPPALSPRVGATRGHWGQESRAAESPTPRRHREGRSRAHQGGGGGIRTPGGLPHGGFQNRCLQPLGHTSVVTG